MSKAFYPSVRQVVQLNLKVSYHYTYFIYPFLVDQDRYREFIGKFLGDKENWQFYIRNNTTDLNTNAYFLPYVKKFLFPTLYWKKDFAEMFLEMSWRKQLDVASRLTCINFKYLIRKGDGAGNIYGGSGINCAISSIDLFCFETGVCFLVIKAGLENSENLDSEDILNFNYKFRTINPRYLKKKKSEGMSLKNQEFNNVEDLSGFIARLLYGFEDVEKENIYFDRLFTYSYMCLDESEWNENRHLEDIINEFYKFQYVLPSEYGSTFDPDFKGIKDNTYTRWKYSIYGFCRESGVVFSSEREKFNSTKLPYYFENMYFYIFLLAFYQRISLILFSEELMTDSNKNIERLKNQLTKFTHFSWFSQITNSEQGMDLWKKWQKAFDLPQLFDEVQKEYAEFYDYTVARGQERINLLLIFIYVVSVIFTGMSLMVDFDIINVKNAIAKIFMEAMFGLTIFVYPLYVMLKGLVHWYWKRLNRHNL